MTTNQFITNIRNLIANDEMDAALGQLQLLLDNSPQLDEAIIQAARFQDIRKQIRLGLVSHAEADLTKNQIRFGLLELLKEIELEGAAPLPATLADDLITDRTRWLQSIQRELLRQNVSVSNRPADIIQHFGWLIEEFLRKMQTQEGQQSNLRAFSYMTEAWQNTLRYLCHIQVAQLLRAEKPVKHPALANYIAMRVEAAPDGAREPFFDYLNLLLVSTDPLKDLTPFVPEINDFVTELTDTESELFDTALFLAHQRRQLLSGRLTEEDADLPQRLDEYRTALVYWLRKIAFLAKYRLVSIKEINLNYRLGTARQFVHLYGELHGLYDQYASAADYNILAVEDSFTYNHSVLLFKGSDILQGLQQLRDRDTILSLSPLLIDQSVFSEKPTQTPEIYYFSGQTPGSRQYEYAQYKNELQLGESPPASNKTLRVKAENTQQPRLNDLYEQLEVVFKPFKTASA